MKTRFWLKLLFALVTCIAVLIASVVWLTPGIAVTVINSGSTSLNALQVHVTGRTYNLGNLASQAQRKCTVRSNGESHIEITFQLPDGTHKRHIVDCYFERGYRGSVEIELKNGDLIREAIQITVGAI